MASVRCVRSLLRNSSKLSVSSKLVLRSLNSSSLGSRKSLVSLRSCLKDVGLLNISRNNTLSSRLNFSKNFRPASMLCNLSTMSIITIDGVGAVSDALDGSIGDDEGETWSQNSEEGYIGDDT